MHDIASLSKRLGYIFKNSALLEVALTHRSAGRDHYERMEFLGDAVLNLVISDALFQKFPDAAEGQLSRLRASLVKGDNLSKHARQLELGEYLRLGSGELKSGGYRRKSILADVFESIIGAIYLDAGFESARDYILNRFASQIAETSLSADLKDPKTRLQELLQARGCELPSYEIHSTTGKAHNQVFEVKCLIELLPEPVLGSGPSRRKAEQAAAKQVLTLLDEST